MTENKRFVYEVTDTGKYYYDNGVRIYPEDFWQIIHDLNNENEQLKQRNNRQAKQLDNLYHLIENEDWQTLKGIIQEFQECEEQLQREWKTYNDGDVE